jgi:Asp-tRNA(Asn)/Glu-tRNA(Gln) amidotransferase B subunit
MSENKLEKPPLLNVDKSEEFAKLVCDRHPEYLAMFKAGKSVVGYLMTEAMRECKGSVNPSLMREAIIEELTERMKK